MKREDFTIDGIPEGYIVYDVDLTPSGRPVAAVAHAQDTRMPGYVVTGLNTRLQLPDESRRLLPGPVVAEPIVRSAGEERIVLVKPRHDQKDEPSGSVLDHVGTVRATFSGGDGVEDVLASSKWIVLTYFDEGVFGGVEPADEGLAFFDINGSYQFGYRTIFGDDAVDVIHCYAAVWVGEDALAFCPYTGFEVVLLYLDGPRQEVFKTPDDLHGSSAITKHEDKVYFYSPYKLPGQVLAWRVGDAAFESIASFSANLRGLPGGRFIAPKPDGYTILSFD